MIYKELEQLIETGKVRYHHRALQRGYFGKKQLASLPITEVVPYSGRFGRGYIRHIPTVDSFCSNDYHAIEYYIFV
jgi:hypothetical protein